MVRFPFGPQEEPRRADSNATPSSGPVSLTPETPSVAGTAGTGATATAAGAPFYTGELALRPVGPGSDGGDLR